MRNNSNQFIYCITKDYYQVQSYSKAPFSTSPIVLQNFSLSNERLPVVLP